MNDIVSIYGIADRNRVKYPGYVHDHNFCVTDGNNLHGYYHLERITRTKYDNNLPEHIEDLLLTNANHSINENSTFLFINSFVGSSFLSKNGRIRFDCNNQNADLLHPEPGYCWIQDSDWNGFKPEAYSISHEIAHAFSSVPFAQGLRENSLLISFDGGSSRGNFAAFHYNKGKLQQLENHWDLASLSKLYNDNGLSFGILGAEPGEHCSVPGKLMGYSSWGKNELKIQNWLKENNYFKDSWNERHDFYEKASKDFEWEGELRQNEDQFLYDIAASFQETFRTGILNKIQELARQTEADYLYYAGGCALNIVANADLVKLGWFKDVFISPCCNDSGLSIGAAAYWAFLQQSELKVDSPYLNGWSCKSKYEFTTEDIRKTADALAAGSVIGVCNGFAEAGPRALGNRSILSLANSTELSSKVSMEIKGREWYRPVAPIMLEENAKLFTGLKKIHHLSKYMLLDFDILPQFREELAGVVHANGTARIQTINKSKENPFIYSLLMYLDNIYGIKALINTSFNGKGEPIVQTAEDALISAKNMGLNGIVINGKYKQL
jgi:carbamoyltransferase